MNTYNQFQLIEGLARMMGLSLWQPWASLIAWGFKQYETRSWATNYRGPLVIQAAKSTKGLSWNNEWIENAFDVMCEVPADLPLGAALCVVDLVDCYRTETLVNATGDSGLPIISEREKAYGDWSRGRFAWKLSNVRRINPPILMRGYQQIFDIDPEVRDRITRAIGGINHG